MPIKTLFAVALTTACIPSVVVDETRPFSASRTITGIYKYVDGDVLFYSCGGDTCADRLIRDAYLQKNGHKLSGEHVTLKVKRVMACDQEHGDEATCLRGAGSALRIVQWVSPAAGSTK
jgi:hypothetical protein